MKRTRWTALIAVLVVSVGTLVATAVTAGAQSSGGEAPKATDVGITATEIHVAVIADVDNPIYPNLFKGSKDAVEGAAKFLNSKAGGGGLAGRKVVVDFYDSKLNANATTNAEIQACQNDVAAVGTSAVVRSSSVERDAQLQGLDRRGDGPTRHPVRHHRTGPAVLGPVVPDGSAAGDLLHRNPAPADLPAERGPRLLLQEEVRRPARHLLFGSDSKSARDSSFVSGIGQLRQVCCKSDQDFDISSFAPQSAYTPVVQTMKNKGSNYGQANSGTPTDPRSARKRRSRASPG